VIRLHRAPLLAAEQNYLATQTARLEEKATAEHVVEAKRLWRQKSAIRFGVIRAGLESMCSGFARCMYCEDSRSTDIDHFEPKALVPLRTFDWVNYVAACSYCNSNEKRDAFPRDARGRPLLVDPTAEEPGDHLTYSPSTGIYEAREGSPKGEPTVRTFGLNRRSLPEARQDAWTLMECGIVMFAEAMDRGDVPRASRIRAAATRHPFAGVLRTLVAAAATPELGMPRDDCRDALARYPEVELWL
jgi:uncharacterized protein (TIGR02646 family)